MELYPSLGLLQLGAFLRARGTDVSMVDLTFARDLTPLSRALRSERPQLVGVHTKTLTFDRSVEIAAEAKAAGAFVVAGGPDSATRVESYLDAGFDAVVPGEGEAHAPRTFPEGPRGPRARCDPGARPAPRGSARSRPSPPVPEGPGRAPAARLGHGRHGALPGGVAETDRGASGRGADVARVPVRLLVVLEADLRTDVPPAITRPGRRRADGAPGPVSGRLRPVLRRRLWDLPTVDRRAHLDGCPKPSSISSSSASPGWTS